MKPTMYLVDHENIRSPLFTNAKEDDYIHIFYTSNASNISLDSFQEMTARVVTHKVPAGKQSLDMHLVGHLGYLIGKHGSDFSYSIISHDSDYIKVVDYFLHITDADIVIISAIQSDTAEISVPSATTNVDPETTFPSIATMQLVSQSNKDTKKSSLSKTELNGELNRILGKRLPHPEGSQVTSTILKYYGEKNIKLQAYRLLVQKYKQKKGLSLYNEIKPLL